MNRFSEQARYVPELPRNAELLQITGIRLQRIHFFDDVSLDVCEVLSQVRTPLPLDLFFKHLSIAAKQQLFSMANATGAGSFWKLFVEFIRQDADLSVMGHASHKAGASGADCY